MEMEATARTEAPVGKQSRPLRYIEFLDTVDPEAWDDSRASDGSWTGFTAMHDLIDHNYKTEFKIHNSNNDDKAYTTLKVGHRGNNDPTLDYRFDVGTPEFDAAMDFVVSIPFKVDKKRKAEREVARQRQEDEIFVAVDVALELKRANENDDETETDPEEQEGRQVMILSKPSADSAPETTDNAPHAVNRQPL